MSQRAVFVEVDCQLIRDVFHALPDEADARDIVADLVAEGEIEEKGSYEVSAVWYEIGEGESGMDNFFPEEKLICAYEKDGLAEIGKSYNVERIDEVSHDVYI